MDYTTQRELNAKIYVRDAYEVAFVLGALGASKYDYDYQPLFNAIYVTCIDDEDEFDDFMDDIKILVNVHKDEVCRMWRLENESKD